MRDDLAGLQMKVPTDSLGLLKFAREVNNKYKSVVEEVESLQRTVTDETASWKGLGKELAELKGSVAASDALTAKLTEFKKS